MSNECKLMKSEQFAVSLRKKKKEEILMKKRIENIKSSQSKNKQ